MLSEPAILYLPTVECIRVDIANGISSQMVLLTNAHGMTLTDPTRDTITTSAFMETSENGYAVTESEQKQGTYELGVVATETISSGDDSSSDSSDAEATDTTTDDSERRKILRKAVQQKPV